MPHILDYLADRVLLCDGAMGTQMQARHLEVERDYHGHENCTDILCESRPDLVREIHMGYLRAGADAVQTNSFGGSPVTLGEFGIADKAHRRQPPRRRAGARGGRGLRRRRPRALRHRLGRPRHAAALPRPYRLPDARGCARRAMPRPRRRRGRCHPGRDLPGHAADQGGGERGQARPRRGGQGHADLRAGHGRDHRHAAGRRRHRGGRHRHRRARRADARHQLRHRPAGDGRACQMAERELAGPRLGAAQCRPAGAGGRPHALSAEPVGARAMAGALRRRGRRQSHRRLLRHRRAAYPGARRHAAAARRRRLPAAAQDRAAASGSRRSPRSMPRRRCARRMPISPSASAAMPTAPSSSASSRRRATGMAASRWRASRPRRARTPSTSAPPSSAATRSPI